MKKPVRVKPRIIDTRLSDAKGGPIRQREPESKKKLVMIETRCGNHLGIRQVNKNVPRTYAKANAE